MAFFQFVLFPELLLLQKTEARWILSVGLSDCALRCQVKGLPEGESERKPFFFSDLWASSGNLTLLPMRLLQSGSLPWFLPTAH